MVTGQRTVQTSALDAESAALAEDTVMNNTLEAAVVVLGKTRTLTPLPGFYARKVGGVLNKISRAFEKFNKLTDDEKSALSSPLGGQEEEICQSLCDAIALLGEYYQWEDVSADLIDRRMTVDAQQHVLQEQMRINGKNDFLLVPLRIGTHIISGTMRRIEEAASKELDLPDSTADSANSGALVP